MAFGYCRWLRLSVWSVRVCGNHLLVRAITHHPFKLGSPNLDNRCKRPWLRSLLFLGVIDLAWPSRSNLTPESKLGLHIVTDFFDIDTNTDTTFRYRISIRSISRYPRNHIQKWGYSTLKSGELPSRAPHTTYCNCLCSKNVQWQLPTELARAVFTYQISSFYWNKPLFLCVSTMIFYYIIVNFSLKYQM